MSGLNKKQICRFDVVNISELEKGDRFHFPKSKTTVFTFFNYSENEKGYIFKEDRNPKEKIIKKDIPVVFLRKTIV